MTYRSSLTLAAGLLGLLLVVRLPAQPMKLDSLTVGSETYSNVTFLGANATDLYFTHSRGIANVKLEFLSPELQKQFHYDPHVAAAAERKRAESEALYQKNLVENLAQQARAAAQAASHPEHPDLADPISAGSLLGKTGPAIKPEAWLGDPPDLNGKFVLVSFWAPWSVPCRKAIPSLNALQKKFSDKLIVVGISTNSAQEISDMAGPKIDFPCGIDSKGKLASAAAVTSIPCVLLLDPKGTVLYQGHPAAVSEQQLQALVGRP